ncbi:MAG: ferritin family protein [Candidatus Aenigmatarchaeota archaeon]
MLSEKPIKIDEKDSDKQILRLGIIAELDAINLYEQLASKAKNEKIKKILLDIAKEEKTHVGEFLSLLLEIDKEQEEELKKGEKEVKEII